VSAADGRAAQRILELLAERGETLAVAESLTGGLVAARFTAVAGASRAFRGSVTAYATDLKRRVLGVDGDLLAERGAVDPEVARQMARGARRVLGADWGLATTGVAGPDRQDGQPVGTVFTAAAGPHGAQPVVLRLHAEGGREDIRQASVEAVLGLLTDQLTAERAENDTQREGGRDVCSPE
jgi:nicotinamide-nucleotide amidase